MPITPEQYEELAARVRGGHTVELDGRTAIDEAQLAFIVDAAGGIDTPAAPVLSADEAEALTSEIATLTADLGAEKKRYASLRLVADGLENDARRLHDQVTTLTEHVDAAKAAHAAEVEALRAEIVDLKAQIARPVTIEQNVSVPEGTTVAEAAAAIDASATAAKNAPRRG